MSEKIPFGELEIGAQFKSKDTTYVVEQRSSTKMFCKEWRNGWNSAS